MPLSSADPAAACLRVVFEAVSLRRAAAVAAELEATARAPARIHLTAPLLTAASLSEHPRTWTVELTTPAMPLELAALQQWERKMVSVENKCQGSRFLGWTTPWLRERRLRQSTMADHQPGDAGALQSQRELVTESLLRRPRAKRPGIVHGRIPPR